MVTATVLLQQIRRDRLWHPLGHTSLLAWIKADSPWAVSTTYRRLRGGAIPAPPPAAIAGSPGEDATTPSRHDAGDYDGPGDPTDAALSEPAPTYHDRVGAPISKSLATLFNVATQFDEIWDRIQDIRRRLVALGGHPAGAELTVHSRMESACQYLDGLEGIMLRSRPWAQCPYCAGQDIPCQACQSRRWVTTDQLARMLTAVKGG